LQAIEKQEKNLKKPASFNKKDYLSWKQKAYFFSYYFFFGIFRAINAHSSFFLAINFKFKKKSLHYFICL